MTLQSIASIALGLAAIPALLFIWNFFLIRTPKVRKATRSSKRADSMSVLIPARNEASRIGAAIESVLANRNVDFELLILDDDSSDGTATIVELYAGTDSRVRLVPPGALPSGWCGKQYACHRLAQQAKSPVLLFMDADVRLAPDALERMGAFLEESGAALVSGVPRQRTNSVFEKLLIPLVHFVLLGFLPVWRMRRCTKPAYAAGCGQLFVCNAAVYHRVGGHSAIRDTLHDGIRLPRLFRQNGFRTDLFDATRLAECRMYEGARDVWNGLTKNAHEGMASPGLIIPMTLFLIGSQITPWVLLGFGGLFIGKTASVLVVAVALTLLPRMLAAWRFRQSYLAAILHPLSVALFLGIQWHAFFRSIIGRPAEWRGRDYPVSASLNSPSKAVKALRREPV